MEILVFINKVMVIMVILLTTITMVDTKITSKDLTALSFRLFRQDIELFLGSPKNPYWLNQLIKTCLYVPDNHSNDFDCCGRIKCASE